MQPSALATAAARTGVVAMREDVAKPMLPALLRSTEKFGEHLDRSHRVVGHELLHQLLDLHTKYSTHIMVRHGRATRRKCCGSRTNASSFSDPTAPACSSTILTASCSKCHDELEMMCRHTTTTSSRTSRSPFCTAQDTWSDTSRGLATTKSCPTHNNSTLVSGTCTNMYMDRCVQANLRRHDVQHWQLVNGVCGVQATQPAHMHNGTS